MTTFSEISFDNDPEDMDGSDAVETLAEFKRIHEENSTAYDDLKEEVENLAEFKETVEKLEDAQIDPDEVLEFKEELKESAVEGLPIEKSELADTSFSRLMELSGSDVTVETDEAGSEGEEDEPDSKFSEGNPSDAGLFEGADETNTKFAKEAIEDTFGGSSW